jgi:hypothetical protein
MIINGHLTFHPDGQGELRNAIIERLAGGGGGTNLPTVGMHAGRIVYNTDDNTFYYYTGTSWGGLTTVGNVVPQAYFDSLLTASGGIYNPTGTYNPTTLDAGSFTSGASNLADAILQLDSVVAGIDTDYVNTAGDTMSGDLNMGSNFITSLSDPIHAQDAATKHYVDSVAEGLKVRSSANYLIDVDLQPTTGNTYTYYNGPDNDGRGATITSNVNSTWPTSIDGVDTSQGDRVLLVAMANAAHNGLYVLDQYGQAGVSPWQLRRCTECDSAENIPSSYVFIQYGDTYKASGWVASVEDVSPPAGFNVGVDPINWIQFSDAGSYQAGSGLTLVGSTFNVNVGSGLNIVNDNVSVELYDPTTSALILTTNGTSRSTSTGASLHLLLANNTLVQGTSGLKLADLPLNRILVGNASNVAVGVAVTGDVSLNGGVVTLKSNVVGLDKLSSFGAPARLILSDALGNPQYVTLSGDVSVNATGAVTISAGVVDNENLTNDSVTISDGTTSTNIALGGTLTFVGGTLTTATVTPSTVTIDVEVDTNDLGDVDAAATESGQVLVANVLNNYVPRKIHHIHQQDAASMTWVVEHNLGQKYCNVIVVDENDDVIIPQNIRFNSTTTLTVSVNVAITGKVIVMGVAGA